MRLRLATTSLLCLWTVIVLTALTSCTHQALKKPAQAPAPGSVVIEKEPPELEKRYVEDGVRVKESPDSGHTKWFFHFYPQFSYDVVDKRSEGGSCIASLKVTAVKVRLSLPMTMFLSRKAKRALLEHEDGHVKICTRAYARADEIARRSADAVVGQLFSGKGADLESACQSAIDAATVKLSADFREQIVRHTGRVSDLYDAIAAGDGNHSHKTVDEQIHLAEMSAQEAR